MVRNKRLDRPVSGSTPSPPDTAQEALEAAYRFITQPKQMERREMGGPTVITYETYRYNEITGQLRRAIGWES